MQAKEFQGKMHRSEDVQKMTADLLYFVRGGLVALAGRCATDCAASSEPAEVQKIIEHEVHEILKDLSEYKYDPKDMTSWCGSGLTVNLTLTSTMEKMKNKSA